MSDTETTRIISEDVRTFFAGVIADLTNQRLFEQYQSLQARIDSGNREPAILALNEIAVDEMLKRGM